MPAAGIVYRDLTNEPVPVVERAEPLPYSTTEPVVIGGRNYYGNPGVVQEDDPNTHDRANKLADGNTDSHALATQNPELEHFGVVHHDHDEDTRNLGWFEPKENIPSPLVGGIDNEDLWLLIRRFNKQVYYVKETTRPVPGGLDMNVADEDEFSPDKLRATVERLYMTVGIGLFGFYKHIARVRSWRERRRTTAFCAAYFLAWLLDLIMPLMFAVLIVLIVHPPSRPYLFPPAPLALVDTKTGGVQKPKAGVLGSLDSVTGAPENHRGEAVEQEASNFFNSIAHVALSSMSGKHPMNDTEEDSKGGLQGAAPDPTAMAMSAGNARTAAAGGKTADHQDKTKVPMETAMWNKMRPLMHILGDVADYWERFENALSPISPFPRNTARHRLAAVFVPLFAIGLITTNYMFMKAITFGVGFGFFGDPVIIRGVKLLNKTFPHWQRLLELRRNLLKGVPTHAQVTITLLRIGEANKAPLPPPPMSNFTPPNERAEITNQHLAEAASGSDQPMGATHDEILAAASYDPNVAHETTGSDVSAAKEHKHGGKGKKLLGLFKTGVRGAVETALGADRLKANVIGSVHAKDRLGVLPAPDDPENLSGPTEFKARHGGKKGHMYISARATIPLLAFTTDSTVERIGTQNREDLHPIWSVAIADISGIKKVGGFGWKAKLVIGWALNREIADGMEIETRRGETWKVTAMPMRDELFNRLVAMGGQKWESW